MATKRKKGELSTMQVLVAAGPDAYLPPGVLRLSPAPKAGWARKVRQMRRDATIGFLRDMFMAPILAAEWTVTSDDPKYAAAVENVEKSTVPHRVKFLEDGFQGLMDFGWQPYETVLERNPDGTFFVRKHKPLLQDFTDILVDEHGRLLGVNNVPIYRVASTKPVEQRYNVDLYRGECVVLYRQTEGTNWYGEPLMRRCERPYDSWLEADDAARRFDNKVAGATWVMKYPEGTTRYNGVETDNEVIASDILRALASSGKIAIPYAVSKIMDDLNNAQGQQAWSVELISAQTQQSTFVDREKYIDALKARGIGIPERAIFEGQFGTKAEAEAHADFAVDNLEMAHAKVVALVNEQEVDPLVELNNGPEFVGHVRLEAAPLQDAKRKFIRDLYTSYFNSPNGQAVEQAKVDFPAIRDQLGIPVTQGLQPGETEHPQDVQDGEPAPVPFAPANRLAGTAQTNGQA
jgi:hypothetical protein